MKRLITNGGGIGIRVTVWLLNRDLSTTNLNVYDLKFKLMKLIMR